MSADVLCTLADGTVQAVDSATINSIVQNVNGVAVILTDSTVINTVSTYDDVANQLMAAEASAP